MKKKFPKLFLLTRLLTKNLTSIPIMFVSFNYKFYKEKGRVGSCMFKVHPLLREDEYIKEKLNHIVDYIRWNYDMDKLI